MEDSKEKPEDMAEDMAEAGRGTDTVMAHMSLGEVVIPRAFLDDPEVMQAIRGVFESSGADMAEFTVGDPANKINPETGYPEFFLKKAFKAVKKIAGSDLGKLALAAGTAYFAPGLGASIGGALGAGAAAAPIVGGTVLGAGTSALTGGNVIRGAALGGIGSALNSAVTGKLNDTALGRAVSDGPLGDVYRTASGAFKDVSNGADSLYQGSALQDAFKSGGDALKSIGIDTAGTAPSVAPSVGGGASSYGGTSTNYLGDNFSLGKADFGNAALEATQTNPFTSTALESATKGAAEVASSRDYASPILSALLGTRANDKAEKALLAGQRANQELLAPYTSGFSFTPGDLTQDPGYQFNLAEGERAQDRSQLARGGYFSGNALREARTFGQGLADNTYQSAFARALQGRQAGLTGALAGAGINTDIGNIRANSATNSSNLLSGALGSALGGRTLTNEGALQGGFDIQEFLRRNGIGSSAYAG